MGEPFQHVFEERMVALLALAQLPLRLLAIGDVRRDPADRPYVAALISQRELGRQEGGRPALEGARLLELLRTARLNDAAVIRLIPPGDLPGQELAAPLADDLRQRQADQLTEGPVGEQHAHVSVEHVEQGIRVVDDGLQQIPAGLEGIRGSLAVGDDVEDRHEVLFCRLPSEDRGDAAARPWRDTDGEWAIGEAYAVECMYESVGLHRDRRAGESRPDCSGKSLGPHFFASISASSPQHETGASAPDSALWACHPTLLRPSSRSRSPAGAMDVCPPYALTATCRRVPRTGGHSPSGTPLRTSPCATAARS